MVTESRIVVRYAETDQMGIVHHSNYPVWYEVGRTDFIKAMGISYSEMENRGILVPLLSLDCQYRRPALYEDELTVRTHLVRANAVKMEFEYQIFKKGEYEPINTGHTLHGIVNHNLQPIPLKRTHPDIYEMLQNALQDEK